MRTTALRRTAVSLALVAALAVGCGVDADQQVGSGAPIPGRTPTGGTPAGGSTGSDALPTIGSLPAPAAPDEPVASVRSCERGDGDIVLVEAVVTNTTSIRRQLQGVPLTVVDADGDVVSAEHEDLWSSVTISPGRRTLLRERVDLAEVGRGELSCELGEPDLREDVMMDGQAYDPADIELAGCAPIGVTVPNPTDEEVATRILVEAFDANGLSAGVFDLGQMPTVYSDGTEPGPDEVGLPPGETGRYSLDPSNRIDDWGTPLDGAITSCEVVAATYLTDPGYREVIVG